MPDLDSYFFQYREEPVVLNGDRLRVPIAMTPVEEDDTAGAEDHQPDV